MCLLNIATCSFGTLRMFVLLLIQVLTVINGSQVTLEGGSCTRSGQLGPLIPFFWGDGSPAGPAPPWEGVAILVLLGTRAPLSGEPL